jgi:hypothetical protein
MQPLDMIATLSTARGLADALSLFIEVSHWLASLCNIVLYYLGGPNMHPLTDTMIVSRSRVTGHGASIVRYNVHDNKAPYAHLRNDE